MPLLSIYNVTVCPLNTQNIEQTLQEVKSNTSNWKKFQYKVDLFLKNPSVFRWFYILF